MQDKIFLISNNRLPIKEIIEKSDGLLQISKKYDSFSLDIHNGRKISIFI